MYLAYINTNPDFVLISELVIYFTPIFSGKFSEQNSIVTNIVV